MSEINKQMEIDWETLEECYLGYEFVLEGKTFKTIVYRNIYDKKRWHVLYQYVFKDLGTGKFYEVIDGEGATEQQDCLEGPLVLHEVYPKITIQYSRKQTNTALSI